MVSLELQTTSQHSASHSIGTKALSSNLLLRLGALLCRGSAYTSWSPGASSRRRAGQGCRALPGCLAATLGALLCRGPAVDELC
ncbi:hypothetical protein BDA96_01G167700 [Sorghum bicolor]|uniref:Uncharacterized protein n=2 Tax=Sorghum bicolor TaxID=4558 RepID=A0A921UXX2_SORBI|nr:hypothetical protein BDA96_01G167700 [Sorghum bicolor]OQU91287.1 hypothetical protein SORBI_3001G159250 [Sorghum bicolor]